MPSLARNRFRLAPLNGQQAFEAVCRPGGDLLTPKTAARIVRFVGTGRRRGRHLGDLSVEPALLSLVCRELNNRRLAAGAAAVALLFVVFAWLQLQKTNEALRLAEEQGRLALSRFLAVKSAENLQQHPPLALLLGVEAVKASQVPMALEALHDAVQRTGGQPLVGHEGAFNSVAWDPDGGRLASAGYDGTVRIWNIAPKYLIPAACRRTGRNLTWDEYERYLEANMPFRTCEQWPVHPSVIAEAERLARRGLMDEAVTLLKRVKEEQPDLDLDPETHAREAAERARAGRDSEAPE